MALTPENMQKAMQVAKQQSQATGGPGDDVKKKAANNAVNIAKSIGDSVVQGNPEDFNFQMKRHMDNVAYRADNQSWLDQAGNAVVGGVLKGVNTMVEDYSYLLDVENNLKRMMDAEDVERNVIADWAIDNKEKIDEMFPIYRRNPGQVFDWSDSGFYWEALKGIIDSAVGFGGVGLGAGAAVKGVGKLANLSTKARRLRRASAYVDKMASMAEATGAGYLTNFAEGKMMALELYDRILEENRDRIVRGEVTMDQVRREAGRAADTFMLNNKAFMLTDAFALKGLFHGAGAGRGIVRAKNFRNTMRDLAKQAPVEYFEEVGQNVFQMENDYQASKRLGKEMADSPKDTLKRIMKFATSEQAQLEGLMGLFGGPVQYAAVQMPSDMANKSEINRIIKEQETQAQTIKEFLPQVFEAHAAKLKMLDEMSEEDSLNEMSGLLHDVQLTDLGIASIERGMMEGKEGNVRGLINQISDIANLSEEEADTLGLPEQYKQIASEMLTHLKEVQTEYTKASRFANSKEVTKNRMDVKSMQKFKDNYVAASTQREEAFKADLQEKLGSEVDMNEVMAVLKGEKAAKDSDLDRTIKSKIAGIKRSKAYKRYKEELEIADEADKFIEEGLKEDKRLTSEATQRFAEKRRMVEARQAAKAEQEAKNKEVQNIKREEANEQISTGDKKKEKEVKDKTIDQAGEIDKAKGITVPGLKTLNEIDGIVGDVYRDGNQYVVEVKGPDGFSRRAVLDTTDKVEEYINDIYYEAVNVASRHKKLQETGDTGSVIDTQETHTDSSKPDGAYSGSDNNEAALESEKFEAPTAIEDYSNLGAFRSREGAMFSTVQDADGNLVRVVQETTNEIGYKDLLDPDNGVQPGTKVELKVVLDDPAWQEAKDLPVDKQVDVAPIGAYIDGKLAFYVHLPSFPLNRIEDEKLRNESIRKIREMRRYILTADGPVQSSITNMSRGVLNRDKDDLYKPLVTAFKGAVELVVGNRGNLVKLRGGENFVDFNPAMPVREGMAYAVLPAPDGELYPVPLQRQILRPQVVDSLTEASMIYMRYLNDQLTERDNEVLRQLEEINIDITQPGGKGLREYMSMFVHVYQPTQNKDNASLKDLYKAVKSDILLLDVAQNGVDFAKGMGTYYKTGKKDYRNNPVEFEQALRNHIASMYANINLDLLTQENQRMPLIDPMDGSVFDDNQEGSYQDYVKRNVVQTSIVEYELPGPDKEQKKYGYFIQPNIEFSTAFMESGPASQQDVISGVKATEAEQGDTFETENEVDVFDASEFEGLEMRMLPAETQGISDRYRIKGFRSEDIMNMMQHIGFNVFNTMREADIKPSNKKQASLIITEQYNEFMDKVKRTAAKEQKDKMTAAKALLQQEEKFIEALKKYMQYTFGIKFSATKEGAIEEVEMNDEGDASKDNYEGDEESKSVDKMTLEVNSETKDPRETMGFLTKAIMSTIIDTSAQGKTLWNLPKRHDFNKVYSITASILSGVRPEWAAMRQRLEDYKDAHDFIPQLIATVESTADQDGYSQEINQFVSDLSMHRIPLMKLLQKGFGENFEGIFIEEGEKDVTNNVRGYWLQSFLDTVGGETGIANPDMVREAYENYQAIQAYYFKNRANAAAIEDVMVTQIAGLFNSVGITLSNEGAKYIYNYGIPNRTGANTTFDAAIGPEGNRAAVITNLMKEMSEVVGEITESDFYKSGKINIIANVEALISPEGYTSVVDSGGKKIYINGKNKHMTDLTIQMMSDLNKKTGQIEGKTKTMIDNMKQSPFYKNGFWMDNISNFIQNLGYTYNSYDVMGIFGRTSTYKQEFNQLSEPDQEKLRLLGFQNQGTSNGNFGWYIPPTFSDKAKTIWLKSLRMKTGIVISPEGEFSISDATLERIYKYMVQPEIDRFTSYSPNHDIKDYHMGAQMFHSFPGLNTIEDLFVTEPVVSDKKDADGNAIVYSVRKLNAAVLGDEEIHARIKAALKEILNKQIQGKIKEWERLDLIEGASIIDKNYYNDFITSTADRDTQLLELATAYELNGLLFNWNYMQFYATDPANFYKSDHMKGIMKKGKTPTNQDWERAAIETQDNINKRLAGEIAPGIDQAGKDDQSIKIAVVADVKLKSKAMDYKESIMGSAEAKKAYGSIDTTDGFEFTTLAHRLATMVRMGRISKKQAEEFEKKADSMSLTPNDIALIITPEKPVYNGNLFDDRYKLFRKIYIKSSSFPIIPQIVSEDMRKINDAMKKQGIDRLVFASAIKAGGVANPAQIHDTKTGRLRDDIDLAATLEESSIAGLSGKNFRVQQEILYNPDKKYVNRVSQATKQMFFDRMDDPKYQKLMEKYNKLWGRIYKQSFDQLQERLKVGKNGMPDVKAVEDFLREEGIERGKSNAFMEAIKMNSKGKFIFPLWASGHASVVEPVLNSIVKNRVIKQKMPGKSLALMPEVFFAGGGFDQMGIQFTDAFDPEVGLMPARKVGDEMKLNQVIVPWPFKQPMRQFMGEDGKLDMSRIDKELLEGMGFRIPNQGPNSTAGLEIVGFFPPYVKDLIIAPSDFVAQMGSDFDIDKLFTYFKEAKFEDGNLVVKKEGKIGMKHGIIDMHLDLVKDPDPEVQRSIMASLGEGKLNEPMEYEGEEYQGLADFVDKSRYKRGLGYSSSVPFSPSYQRNKFYSALAGKDATGVFALTNTFAAIAQTVRDEITVPLKYPPKTGTLKGLVAYKSFNDKGELVNFYTNIAGKKSLGEMSNIDTMKGRKKSQVASAFLSAAVDNEKLNILARINANEGTFNVIKAMIMLGYDEDTIALFISQDANMGTWFDDDPFNPPNFKATYSEKDMKDMIALGEKSELAYDEIQKLISYQFNKLAEVGAAIAEIESAINVDVETGWKASLHEMLEKESRIEQIVEQDHEQMKVLNAEKTMFEEGEKDEEGTLKIGNRYYKPSKINGFAAFYGVKYNNDFWTSKDNDSSTWWAMPYKDPAILKATGRLSYLATMYDEEQERFSKAAERRALVFKELVKYMSSYNNTLLEQDLPSVTRENLGMDLDGNRSLQSFLMNDLTEEGKALVKKSPLLSRLAPTQEGTKKGDFKILRVLDRSKDPNLENNLYSDAVRIFRNPEKLGTINGEDITTADFVYRQIVLEYLTGRQDKYGSVVKYIPGQVLDMIGLSDHFYNTSFKDMLTDAGLYDQGNYDKFTTQFLQHNPYMIRDKAKRNDVFNKDAELTYDGNQPGNKLNSFILDGSVDAKRDKLKELGINVIRKPETGRLIYPPYIMLKGNKGATFVYIKTSQNDGDNLYERIPVLGKTSAKSPAGQISEYNPASLTVAAASSINSSNPPSYQRPAADNPPETPNSDRTVVSTNSGTIKTPGKASSTFEIDRRLSGDDATAYINTRLNEIIGANNHLSMLAKAIIRVPAAYAGMTINFREPGLVTKAKWNPDEIWIPDASMANPTIYNESFMHELLHQMTALNIKADKNLQIMENAEPSPHFKLLQAARESFFKWLKDNPDARAQMDAAAMLQPIEELPEEFITYVLTNPEIMAYAKKASHKGNKSVWDEIVSVVMDVLKSLGIVSENDNVYDEVFAVVSGLMERAPAMRQAFQSMNASNSPSHNFELNMTLEEGQPLTGKEMLIGRMQAFQSKIRKENARLLVEEKGQKGQKRKRTLARIAANKSKIEQIDNDIENIKQISAIEDITEYGQRDVEYLNNMLGRPSEDLLDAEIEAMTPEDLRGLERTVIMWENIDSDYLNEEERTEQMLDAGFRDIRGKMQEFRKKLDNLYKRKLRLELSKRFGREVSMSEINKQLEDSGILVSQTLDLSRQKSVILKGISKFTADAYQHSHEELVDMRNESKDIFKDLRAALKEKNLDMSIFFQKDAAGRKTGYLIQPYTGEFYKERANLQAKSRAEGATAEDKKKFYDWIKNNTTAVDISRIDDEAYNQEMVEKYGEGFWASIKRTQKTKLDRYELDKEVFEAGLSPELSEREQADAINSWEKEFSPYVYADEKRNRGWKYTYEIPADKWMDKRFDTIRGDDRIMKAYSFISSKFEEFSRYMPDRDDGHFTNARMLPYLNRKITGVKDAMEYGLKDLAMDKFIHEITSRDTREFLYVDEIDKDRTLNPNIILSIEEKVKPLVQKARAEFIAKEGRPPTTDEGREIRANVLEELTEDVEMDMEKMFVSYAKAALAYKHRAAVEDIVRLAEDVFSKASLKDETPSGKGMKTLYGMLGKTTTGSNMENNLDYHLNKFFMGPSYVEGEMDQKVLDSKEKRTKEELEETIRRLDERIADINSMLADMTQDDDRRPELENLVEIFGKQKDSMTIQKDELGANVTASGMFSTLFKYIQLKGMGWNVFSGFTNVGFGQIANYIEAGSNQFYDTKGLNKGMKIVLSGVGRPLSRLMDNSDFIKARALMERYNVLQTSAEELFEQKDGMKSTMMNNIKNPYFITTNTEYLNQAPVMIAMMMKETVKDKATGEYVPIWNAYTADGIFQYDKYELRNENQIEDFRQAIGAVIAQNHGNYDPSRPIPIKKAVMGRALSQFRTWMFEGFAQRFIAEDNDDTVILNGKRIKRKGRYLSYGGGSMAVAGAVLGTLFMPGLGTAAGAATMGALGRLKKNEDRFLEGKDMTYIEELFFVTKQLFRKIAFKKTQFDDRFQEVDAANMRRNMNEIIVAMSVMGFAMLLKHMVEGIDDDDDEWRYTNFMLNTMFRIQQDLSFYSNPMTIEQISRSTVPATSVLTDGMKWFDAANRFVYGEDEIKTGPYKGASRLGRETARNIPLMTSVVRTYAATAQRYEDVIKYGGGK